MKVDGFRLWQFHDDFILECPNPNNRCGHVNVDQGVSLLDLHTLAERHIEEYHPDKGGTTSGQVSNDQEAPERQLEDGSGVGEASQ